MQNFQWVTSTIVMVLSLGMTRMLGSAVSLFRARRHSRMDWVPFVWALCIFFSLLDFSWVLTPLGKAGGDWTFTRFLWLFVLSLLLFLAAALVLPADLEKGESLRQSFERDGRWALAVFAVYQFMVTWADGYFWHVDPWNPVGIFNICLGLLAIGTLFARRRRLECALTILFACLDLGAIVLLT